MPKDVHLTRGQNLDGRYYAPGHYRLSTDIANALEALEYPPEQSPVIDNTPVEAKASEEDINAETSNIDDTDKPAAESEGKLADKKE